MCLTLFEFFRRRFLTKTPTPAGRAPCLCHKACTTRLFIGGLALIYFIVSCLFFRLNEGWNVLDCIYFSIVVVTTVGYGDFLPRSDGSKLFTVFIVHFALVIVAVVIDSAVTTFASTLLKRMQGEDFEIGVFQQDAMKRRERLNKFRVLVFYLGVLFVGTVVFATTMSWDGQGNAWVNALYLTVITVTTVGFGDYSPDETDGLKIFGICLMLVGIPACGVAFGTLANDMFGQREKAKRLRLIRGDLTANKFAQLVDYKNDLRKENLGGYQNQGEGHISRFEYLCFMLEQNGAITRCNIKNVMKNFDTHDITDTGCLNINDVSFRLSAASSLAEDWSSTIESI